MTFIQSKEELIWNKLNQLDKKTKDAKWLGEVYTDSLSTELKHAIAEKLGLKAKEGWCVLKLLLTKFGPQPELIYGAGLSHQQESRDFLLELLDPNNPNLTILESLSCWGESVPTEVIKKILKNPKQTIRIAALELLKFKANKLSDQELLSVTNELLNDFRDPIVIKTINILQRRDGKEICDAIAKIAMRGSDIVSHYALMALGSIGTENSYLSLYGIINKLPKGMRLELAKKQIDNQYRFDKNLIKGENV